MTALPDTWKAVPKPVIPRVRSAACLVLIYPPGPTIGTRFDLRESPLTLGRELDCEVSLRDPAVSRYHARIHKQQEDVYGVTDLESTNGTFINDQAVTNSTLNDGDYLRVGSSIFRYLSGSNIEAAYHEEVYQLTIRDGLTGIHNKRYLVEYLEREIARSRRSRLPCSLVVFDLDHLKTMNDRLGHLGGDYILRELVSCAQETIRKEDLFARYGGDEFVLVLPYTDLPEASQQAERLRNQVEQHVFTYDGLTFQMTISLGITTYHGGEALTANDLLRRADDKLYQAKREGRNRLIG